MCTAIERDASNASLFVWRKPWGGGYKHVPAARFPGAGENATMGGLHAR